MKNLEERLRELPEIAESTGLQADESLKRKILREAQEKQAGRKTTLRRLVPVLCALAVLLGVTAAALPALRGGSGADPAATDAPLLYSLPNGELTVGDLSAGRDVPQGSISIRPADNPSYRSIWASATGGNFPLIGVNGRYYRLLTYSVNISSAMLGQALGAVDTFTSEPALAGNKGICSNIVAAGEAVYAVSGMSGAVVAAQVDGQMRVFQRVSFSGSDLIGSESLADTLQASSVVALELTGVGTVTDAATANRLVGILIANASHLNAGNSETSKSLLIELSNGLVLQMAVNGERVIACGTWACPEFFDAFQEALQ